MVCDTSYLVWCLINTTAELRGSIGPSIPKIIKLLKNNSSYNRGIVAEILSSAEAAAILLKFSEHGM
jgi:hypothetical protein